MTEPPAGCKRLAFCWLAIVETANNGFVTSSGMTFWLDYLIEGKK
jgi:hypothetical protein